MPDARDIGTPRTTITDRSTGAIAIAPSISNRGITQRAVDLSRGITNIPAGAPISQSDIDAINQRIQQNVAQYIAVPWNSFFGGGQTLPSGNDTTGNSIPKNPFETLADALTKSFGNAQYNPPLQNQAYGYTPVSGSPNVLIVVILAALAIGGYFIYKRMQG